MEPILLWILVVVLVGAGLVGLVLPGIPGAPLLFGGLLLGAWIEDFVYVDVGTLVVLGIMAVLTFVCDIAGTALGAQRYGASRRAILGASIGAFIGIFFGLFGILLGPFIGAVVGELSGGRDLHTATRAGWGATIGLALAAATKLALGFAMIGVFLIVRFV
ncbi:MAG: DUF456 domain-containing protein [Gammaproteobacteria bacterium]|nr:DUF456 domain-containing protein [Gammaproteobacteria bacterium]